jgi:hypothetical protein
MLSFEGFDRWSSKIEVIFSAHDAEPRYASFSKTIALAA